MYMYLTRWARLPAAMIAASLVLVNCGVDSPTHKNTRSSRSADSNKGSGVTIQFSDLTPEDLAAMSDDSDDNVTPTPEPSPTMDPSPTMEPTPSPTAEPTPSPTPTVMPSPTESPSASPTPVATESPQPSVTPTPAPGDDSDQVPGLSDEIDDKERSECAKQFGVPAQSIHVSNKNMELSSSGIEALAIKVTGNQRQLKVVLNGTKPVKGVCIFAAGNQSVVSLQTKVNIGTVLYKGRGNQSSGDIQIHEGASVETIAADLAGNSAKLRIWGNGNFTCPIARTRGNAPQIQCIK